MGVIRKHAQDSIPRQRDSDNLPSINAGALSCRINGRLMLVSRLASAVNWR